MKLPYRCWKCWRRFTLKQKPATLQCPVCCKMALYLDKDRLKRNKEYIKLRCDCDGYWFPHRRGSLQCVKGKDPHGINLNAPDSEPEEGEKGIYPEGWEELPF